MLLSINLTVFLLCLQEQCSFYSTMKAKKETKDLDSHSWCSIYQHNATVLDRGQLLAQEVNSEKESSCAGGAIKYYSKLIAKSTVVNLQTIHQTYS